MALSPKQIHDLAVRHRIGLSRYSTHVVHKVIAQLNRLEREVVARLARTDNESLAGARLEGLLQEIRSIQSAGWTIIRQDVNADVAALAEAEAKFAARLIEPAATVSVDVFTPAPSMAQVVAAVQARPFQGRFLREWLDGTEESVAAKVRDTIRQGFIEGRPTAEIVRTLRGTRAAQYKDGIMEGSRRGVEAMVRTALTHTSSVAHEAVWRANSDVVVAVEWVSTLDARTTVICASRDGKRYPIDSGPRPPAHPNCRSTTTPVLEPIPGVAPFERPTYSAWLKDQPADVQDDVLGPTRAALFRSGALSLDRFVDRGGATLTLDQLRARDASAFRKAGL